MSGSHPMIFLKSLFFLEVPFNFDSKPYHRLTCVCVDSEYLQLKFDYYYHQNPTSTSKIRERPHLNYPLFAQLYQSSPSFPAKTRHEIHN